MNQTTLQVYHDRAVQLANAMELCHDDLRTYSAAVGLLAVHSAISFADAVLLSLTGRRSQSQDHRQAVRAVKKACTQAKIPVDGIKHLDKLIDAKTDISYGDGSVEEERIEFLYVAAGRFQAWAERLLARRRGSV